MTSIGEGSIFAGHRLGPVIGYGGMGIVYTATHIQLQREVALKVIAPGLAADPSFRERFKRESRAAASLNHSHIVTIHDAGEEEGLLYLAMELIDGVDLRQIIRSEGGLSSSESSELITPIADALDAAHELDLVHRDVKPGNILVSKSTPAPVPYLTDFGLTRHMTSAQGITRTGQWIGTLDYIAPEQVKGEAVDKRADVYALACVYFEALSGDVPFKADSDIAKMWAQVHEPPPRLDERRPDVDSEVSDVLVQAMAKDPAERPASAGELARLIAQASAIGTGSGGSNAETVESAVPKGLARTTPMKTTGSPDPEESSGRGRKRNRAIVAVFVALLAAGVGYLAQRQFGGDSTSEPELAESESISLRYSAPWRQADGGEFVPGFKLAGEKIRLDGERSGLIRAGRVADPSDGLDPLPREMQERWIGTPTQDSVAIRKATWTRYRGQVKLGVSKRELTILMVPTTKGYQGIACQANPTPTPGEECAAVTSSARLIGAKALSFGPDRGLAKLFGSIQTNLKEAEQSRNEALTDGDNDDQSKASRGIADVYERQGTRLESWIKANASWEPVMPSVKSLVRAIGSIESAYGDLGDSAASGDSEGWQSASEKLSVASKSYSDAISGLERFGYTFD
jgi:serine/threonine-protein kinase